MWNGIRSLSLLLSSIWQSLIRFLIFCFLCFFFFLCLFGCCCIRLLLRAGLSTLKQPHLPNPRTRKHTRTRSCSHLRQRFPRWLSEAGVPVADASWLWEHSDGKITRISSLAVLKRNGWWWRIDTEGKEISGPEGGMLDARGFSAWAVFAHKRRAGGGRQSKFSLFVLLSFSFLLIFICLVCFRIQSFLYLFTFRLHVRFFPSSKVIFLFFHPDLFVFIYLLCF